MQAQPVTLTVNMGNTVTLATNSHYGLNIETALDPVVAAYANYESSFASSGVKSIRYHGWNMIKQGTSQTWERLKLYSCYLPILLSNNFCKNGSHVAGVR